MSGIPTPQEIPRTLIDDLLAEQQTLTAVERFARRHERHDFPAQERYYRDLIPLTKPGAGEQYAFAVNLDICTGCKACVSACHSLNGLDDDEIWRNIGLIHGGTVEEPYQQIVTTACHHCVDPACLNGCPVKAYEKDAGTGIVRHLDDQCIGCQYCVLKCPYDVPKYSKKRGIVRKCDMCQGRLGAGEAPACVQACPSGAITIRIVETVSVVLSTHSGDQLLPGTFDSSYTHPTTSYTTNRKIPQNARPGDSDALALEHAHWPLIWMLVLTQIAAGIVLGGTALLFGNPSLFHFAQVPLAVAAFAILNLGLAVSVLHLGRPLGAWRAFLGLRTSWMSREIFAFAIFAGSAGAFTGASLWNIAAGKVPKLHLIENFLNPSHFAGLLAVLTAALGLPGIFCSAMIYIDTHRVYWRRVSTFTRFFGATALLGAAGTASLLAWMGSSASGASHVFMIAAVLLRAGFFAWEFWNLHRALHDSAHPDHRSARTIWKLRPRLVVAGIMLFAASMASGILALAGIGTPECAALFFLLTLGSQIIERYQFFTAVIAHRMPGPQVSRETPHA